MIIPVQSGTVFYIGSLWELIKLGSLLKMADLDDDECPTLKSIDNLITELRELRLATIIDDTVNAASTSDSCSNLADSGGESATLEIIKRRITKLRELLLASTVEDDRRSGASTLDSCLNIADKGNGYPTQEEIIDFITKPDELGLAKTIEDDSVWGFKYAKGPPY